MGATVSISTSPAADGGAVDLRIMSNLASLMIEPPAYVERKHKIDSLLWGGVPSALLGLSCHLAAHTRGVAALRPLGWALHAGGAAAIATSMYLACNQRHCVRYDQIRLLSALQDKGAPAAAIDDLIPNLMADSRRMYHLKGPDGAWGRPTKARAPRWWWLSDYDVRDVGVYEIE